MFLLLTLNIFTRFSNVSIVGFEQVNISWERTFNQPFILQKQFIIIIITGKVKINAFGVDSDGPTPDQSQPQR